MNRINLIARILFLLAFLAVTIPSAVGMFSALGVEAARGASPESVRWWWALWIAMLGAIAYADRRSK